MSAVLAKMFPIDPAELQRTMDRLLVARDMGGLVLSAQDAKVLCSLILRLEMRLRELEEHLPPDEKGAFR